MPTIGTIVNPHPPSPSTGKDTLDKSNHGNAPLSIQTESSPDVWLEARSISLIDFNKTHPQENTDCEAAMQHDQLNKTQGSSDTNQPEASTTNTLNNTSTIAKEENILQLNSPVSNPNKKTNTTKADVCEFVINTVTHQTCGKQFSDKNRFNIHKRAHTKEKRDLCTLCDKKFATKQCLQAHMRLHTGDKPYSCDKCNKRFTQQSGLSGHARVHTPIKTCVCDICNKTYSSLSSLKAHKSTHTRKKPYQCDICDKTFTHKCNLTNHQRIHTGDQYTCDICGKETSDLSNFNRHRRRHTTMKQPITTNSVEKRSHTALNQTQNDTY